MKVLRNPRQTAWSRGVMFALSVVFGSGLVSPVAFSAPAASEQVIAYVFVGDRLIQPGEIDASKLTRINYAFANIRDGEIVEGFANDSGNFAVFNSLKKQNATLQVLISVGGWTWSGAFSDMALTKASRKTFIDSAVRFIDRYQLDGLDIDWEYPGMPGMGNKFRAEDKQNYTALLRELRKRFDREEKRLHRRLYTSVATGASMNFLAHTEMRKVARYVDSVNLMSYDYYEPDSDTIAAHHSPLYTNPKDPKLVSTDASVRAYQLAGVRARKIVMGVPFYGHAWGDVSEQDHGLFQPGKKTHLNANYRHIAGNLLGNGYTRYWDPISQAPFLYNPSTRIFVSYEDPESVRLKCRYLLAHHLAGIMFWDYSGDADGALLNAIHEELTGSGRR